jgi:starvation-inducible DNA-binding protein
MYFLCQAAHELRRRTAMPTRDGKRSNGSTATLHEFKTTIDIPAEARRPLCELLNQQLADTADLYSQLKHAHWNVKGHDFYQLHLLFDQLAACPLEWSDLIAERVAMLGGYAMGTVRMAAASTRLSEFPTDAIEGMDHVRALVEAYANYCASTREAIEKSDELGDPTTADMFTEISRDADKNRWFLEAHLQA